MWGSKTFYDHYHIIKDHALIHQCLVCLKLMLIMHHLGGDWVINTDGKKQTQITETETEMIETDRISVTSQIQT